MSWRVAPLTASWPDPSAYTPAFFNCGGPNSAGYYCNPALDHEMRTAELLETTDPPQARASASSSSNS